MITLLLFACAPEVTTRTLTDEGTVCLSDGGDVVVTFPDCLSSSCDTLVSAECSAELVDGEVVVHAEAVIESQGTACTADCGLVQATCTMPLVEDPETVSFSYAGENTPLDATCEGV